MILRHECEDASCHKLISMDRKYCSKHMKRHQKINIDNKKEYDKKYNSLRYEKNPLTRFYHTTRWRKLRITVLARDNYICQECLKHGYIKGAKHVDHIKPAVKRPDLFWDMNNLQSLCPKCHTLKTLKEQRDKKHNHKN